MKASSFGEMLQSLRGEIGCNKTALAKLAGISQPYLSQLESNKRHPAPDTLKKLTEALGNITYPDLLRAAGYEDLAEAEQARSYMDDFYTDLVDKEEFMKLYDRLKQMEGMKDIRVLLESHVNSSGSEKIDPYYNGHSLTQADSQRILDMLKTLFPEYQEEGADLHD